MVEALQEVLRAGEIILTCLHREYPNKIGHFMESDADVAPPRDLTPVFFGCFDWHSAVHSHWALVRLLRHAPSAEISTRIVTTLDRSFTERSLAAEHSYLSGRGRAGFEMPYGMCWLLQLGAELHSLTQGEHYVPRASKWSRRLEPLEQLARDRFCNWLPKLLYPVRTGEHTQTAFALGLVLDWARDRGDDEMQDLGESRVRELFLDDRNAPIHFEPSGFDFLSPSLAEADLVRRVLEPNEFASWLGDFLPAIPTDGVWLEPVTSPDPSDGKLAHLDGLNLSRAWMLEGIVAQLPEDDARRGVLEATARTHREAGLTAFTGEHYAGAHWLGSFAIYLVTARGQTIGTALHI